MTETRTPQGLVQSTLQGVLDTLTAAHAEPHQPDGHRAGLRDAIDLVAELAENSAEDEQVGTLGVALRIGVTYDTARQYLYRGVMPHPDGYLSGSPWWWASTIVKWHESRPGHGRVSPSSACPSGFARHRFDKGPECLRCGAPNPCRGTARA